MLLRTHSSQSYSHRAVRVRNRVPSPFGCGCKYLLLNWQRSAPNTPTWGSTRRPRSASSAQWRSRSPNLRRSTGDSSSRSLASRPAQRGRLARPIAPIALSRQGPTTGQRRAALRQRLASGRTDRRSAATGRTARGPRTTHGRSTCGRVTPAISISPSHRVSPRFKSFQFRVSQFIS